MNVKSAERIYFLICEVNSLHMRIPIIPLLLRSSSLKKITSFAVMAEFSGSVNNKPHELVMDAFCIRQFNNPSYTGTQVSYDITAFEQRINEYYQSGEYPLVDGYAPFW